MSQLNLNESTRDIQSVINSIVGMTLDAPDPLVVSLVIYSSTTGLSLLVWERTDGEPTLLSGNVFIDVPTALDDAIDMESKLAELIIAEKDKAEVTA